MRLTRQLFQLGILAFVALSPLFASSQEVDLTRPETLPELSSYRGGGFKVGMEVEMGREALARLLPYLDDKQRANEGMPEIIRAQRIIKEKRYSDLTPKENIPEDLADTLSRLKWFDGGGVIEFAHKTPLTDPVQYMNDVKTLMSYAGIWEKANSAGRVTHGYWYSHHTHMSRPKGKGKIDPVARAWNALLALDFAELERSDYALGGDFSTFIMDVRHRGQLRVISNNHLETRRQSLNLEDDLKRSLFLLGSRRQVAQKAIRDALTKKLTYDNLAHLLSSGSEKAERLLRVIFSELQPEHIQNLDPKTVDLVIRHGAETNDIPVSLFGRYSSIQDEGLKRLLREKAVDRHHLPRLLKKNSAHYLKAFVEDSAADLSSEQKQALYPRLLRHDSFAEQVPELEHELSQIEGFRRVSTTRPAEATRSLCTSVVGALRSITPAKVAVGVLATGGAFIADTILQAPVGRYLYPGFLDHHSNTLSLRESAVEESGRDDVWAYVELDAEYGGNRAVILQSSDPTMSFDDPKTGSLGDEEHYFAYAPYNHVARSFAKRHGLKKHELSVKEVDSWNSSMRVYFGDGVHAEGRVNGANQAELLPNILQILVDAQKEDSRLALLVSPTGHSVELYGKDENGRYLRLRSIEGIDGDSLELFERHGVKRLNFHIAAESPEDKSQVELIARLIEEERLYRAEGLSNSTQHYRHERPHYYYVDNEGFLEPLKLDAAKVKIDMKSAISFDVDLSQHYTRALAKLKIEVDKIQSRQEWVRKIDVFYLLNNRGLRVEIISQNQDHELQSESIELETKHVEYDQGLIKRYAEINGW